jgi:hypothetical protein
MNELTKAQRRALEFIQTESQAGRPAPDSMIGRRLIVDILDGDVVVVGTRPDGDFVRATAMSWPH